MSSDDKVVRNAGSSADQHITGSPETGSFTTDEKPTGDTPSHGSSNAGINETRANRPENMGVVEEDPA
ncbi:hypothetical protein [Actinoplanes friuliensis]|jgi:hypothetical protein|uniref:Uncharacterized protein n=1 Tax=Actinoplanes friuliensis DSM 7358 TaxID=1246995 RepID=U5W1C4_9ACTN|nr:hypothetical protein [Actinoplanes friuliensis]AGZ42944.1 hypothetical protein AFR_23370 [Actinoplanes friuliensis DSM 7358]